MAVSSQFERDPNIFKDQYGLDILVYLTFMGSSEMMGSPGLYGTYNWSAGSKADALFDGDLEEAISTGLHEIGHEHYTNPESQHRYLESRGGVTHPLNYGKVRRLLEGRFRMGYN